MWKAKKRVAIYICRGSFFTGKPAKTLNLTGFILVGEIDFLQIGNVLGVQLQVIV